MFGLILTLVLTQASAPVRLDNPSTASSVGAVPTARLVDTGTSTATGLSGGGDLSADRSVSCVAASGSSVGCVTTGTQTIAGDKTVSGNLAATNLSGTNTGDVTLGAVGSAPSANGASLSGQVLTLQPEDATHPGVVSNTAQTISGAKTYSSTLASSVASGSDSFSLLQGARLKLNAGTDTSYIYADASQYVHVVAKTKDFSFNEFGYLNLAGGLLGTSSSASVEIQGAYATGAAAVAIKLSSTNVLNTTGAKMGQVVNGGTEKFYWSYDGSIVNTAVTLQACAAGLEGAITRDAVGGGTGGHRTRICVCTSDGAGSPGYKWQNMVSATLGTTTTCAD